MNYTNRTPGFEGRCMRIPGRDGLHTVLTWYEWFNQGVYPNGRFGERARRLRRKRRERAAELRAIERARRLAQRQGVRTEPAAWEARPGWLTGDVHRVEVNSGTRTRVWTTLGEWRARR